MIQKRKYWVARDENGLLFVYLREPLRRGARFWGGTCMSITGMNALLFDFVTWENSPWQISTD